MDRILSARDSLRTSLSLLPSPPSPPASSSLRLRRFSSLLPLLAPPSSLPPAPSYILRSLSPVSSTISLFNSLHHLEPLLLSHPLHGYHLASFLTLLSRLLDTLRLLSIRLPNALSSLHDLADYIHHHSLAPSSYVSSLRSYLRSLSDSLHDLSGGLLAASLDRLEGEFRRHVASPDDLNSLLEILRALGPHGRLPRCAAAFSEARSVNARAALENSGVTYPSVTSPECYIDKWKEDIESLVKQLLEQEYDLCDTLFGEFGESETCFADIAKRAGICELLQFGRTVTEGKKDPLKLLRLLDIFGCLNKQRLNFNKLFGGKACIDIRNETRDLIKRVIEGASEIFWELLVQVELQRTARSVIDGGVPKLVSFILDYCNRLLGDECQIILMQILVIHTSWKKEKIREGLLTDEIVRIVKALELNCDAWASDCAGASLSNLFKMNVHWHFCKSLRGTKVGELMGDEWLREHEQFKDYYMAMYLKDSWRKLPTLLSQEGLVLFSGGRATARDLVKNRLKNFNDVFDDMYTKHSSWVVPDKELRDRLCQLSVQAIVPIYRSYMQNYGPLVALDANASRYVKYTPESLEKVLGCLFLHKISKSSSFGGRSSNRLSIDTGLKRYQSFSTVA